MGYKYIFPEGIEETTTVGTKYLRINGFDTGSTNLRNKLFNSQNLKLITPIGALQYETQTLDGLFGITGGILEYNIIESTFLGGDSGSIYAVTATTPKKSIQSYYPEIATRLKTTSSYSQGYDRPGDYWIPCLLNKDLTEIDGQGYGNSRERKFTPFIYWGLRGGTTGVKTYSFHGNSNRAIQIPFSSSNAITGNKTNAWRDTFNPHDSDNSNGQNSEWVPDFVYPSPLKVKFSASIDSFLDDTNDITSSLYLVAQTRAVGFGTDYALSEQPIPGDWGDYAKTPSLSFNVSSPILVSASLGNPQIVEIELVLTQSYSRILDSPIGIPYSKRSMSPRGILPNPFNTISFPDWSDPIEFGWFLTLYSDNTHSSADNTNHGGGTSPYFISGGNCQADIDFLFREDTKTYVKGQTNRGDYNTSNNPYNAGDYFKSPQGTTVSRPSGSEQTYMVIYPSQSFGPGGGADAAGDAFNKAMLLTASMFNKPDNTQEPGVSVFNNNWAWTTKIPAVTNTHSAVYYQLSLQAASLVIEGGSEIDYINNNFNAVIGNASSQVRSNNYKKIDYANDSVTPSNMFAIQNGTAERAEIVDSSYSSNSWIRGRYKGTRISSNNFNVNN